MRRLRTCQTRTAINSVALSNRHTDTGAHSVTKSRSQERHQQVACRDPQTDPIRSQLRYNSLPADGQGHMKMITLTHPLLVRELAHYRGGLFPAHLFGGEAGALVVKCPKEMILAAKMRRELKFYLLPLDADGVSTHGLVTAFFDDLDEPLVIRTPLLDDDMATSLIDLLSSEAFDIHFFDEHDRELLAYRANNATAARLAATRDTIRLASPTYIPSPKIDDQMVSIFSRRSFDDDASALVVELAEELFPSDFIILDARPDHNSHMGAKSGTFTVLERENPGLYSESDIVRCLHRVFPSESTFLNPLRPDNGKEFVDIMVVTATNLLLIQAKDSPNTTEALRRPIERKISTVRRHLKKATSQIRGSISHLLSSEPLVVECGGSFRTIYAGDLNVISLVIVKELFSTEYKHYSQLAFGVFVNTGVPCIIEDYSEFHNLTNHRRSEESFVETLEQIMTFALYHDEFPRSRFWL